MGFWALGGMIRLGLVMNRRTRIVSCWLAAMLLAGPLPLSSEAKSYSSGGGGRSYSSSSSHSSSSGGGHSFSSGSSHSPSGGSTRSSSSGGSSGRGSRGGWAVPYID